MRRARRIDVWDEGGILGIDAMFRDSAWDPDGTEVVVHEYQMLGRGRPGDGKLLSVTAVPRVLPYAECPGAAPNASWMAGTELRAMRTEVLERLQRHRLLHPPQRRAALAGRGARARRIAARASRSPKSPREGAAMPETLKDKTAVVGIGATPYYKRGESLPQTELELACKAILAALDDAGLTIKDLDGFTIYSSSCDPAQVASVLGVPEVRFAASLTSGGGGSAGSLGLAAAAIVSGQAEVCVTLMTLQQAKRRLGGSAVGGGGPGLGGGGGSPYGGGGVPNYAAFIAGAGLMAPGHSFALLTRRHMELYGTKREHLAEVCISQRENAIRRPTAIRTDPLTLDEYFDARMISDPLCLFDYTMETDGAVAAVVTSAERAKDLRQKPVYIGGSRRTAARAAGARRSSPTSRCPTSTSPPRATGRSPSGCTRWRAWGPRTSTSRCSTTTSPRW